MLGLEPAAAANLLKPTDSGRFPSCMSLRTTLSMAAIWSASTAWRSPNV